MVNIGVGTGIYSFAIVEKNPNIEAVVFDLPYVRQICEKILGANGLSNRTK